MNTPASPARLGICPAHFKFAGTLVPDEQGALPREADGELRLLSCLRALQARSPVPFSIAPVFVFSGMREDDTHEVLDGIKNLGLLPEMILMTSGLDPMNARDEDRFVATAVETLAIAMAHQVRSITSTTFEEWMNEGPSRDGRDYRSAVRQLVQAHARIYREAGLADSCLDSWNLEFLRPLEFRTFTNIRRAWDVVEKLNREIGTNFFRVLVDASHCGDSGLSLEENQEAIREIARAGGLGAFHASAKTTRGCLTTDEGWIEPLLRTCAETGHLESVIIEVFHHDDEGLAPLRAAVPGHGVDTTRGRTYDEVVLDGLALINRRLAELASPPSRATAR